MTAGLIALCIGLVLLVYGAVLMIDDWNGKDD